MSAISHYHPALGVSERGTANVRSLSVYAAILLSYQVNLLWVKSEEDAQKSYEGAQVWRTVMRNLGDVEVIKGLARRRDVSLWSLSLIQADYLLYEDKQTEVRRMLEDHNMNHSVLILNVQRRIDMTRSKMAPWDENSLRLGHRLNFGSFPSPNVIEEYYHYLEENFDSICRIVNIGVTAENRTIKMIKISNGDPSNSPIIVLSGLHSREWIAVSSALYIANNIVTKYDLQPDYMKNKDWYIIPVANPDGYDFTFRHDRLWRKNRAVNNGTPCIGVDLNRNFDKYWKESTMYVNGKCGEDNPGSAPFSEQETIALYNVLKKLKAKKTPKAFVDLHAFGQMIMHPYAGSHETSPHLEYLKSIASLMVQAIKKATNEVYKSGVPTDMMYEAFGTGIDWFHSEGVPLSFAIESRDNGKYGFLAPVEIIEPTGKELLGAIRELAKNLNPDIRRRDGDHSWL